MILCLGLGFLAEEEALKDSAESMWGLWSDGE